MTSLAEVVIATLGEVDPERVVRRRLLRSLPFDTSRGVVVVAFGKAARPMIEGAYAALGASIRRSCVVIPEGTPRPAARRGLVVHEAPHPLPDERSVRAAKAVERLVRTSDFPVLALVSGGASSLVAWPNEGLSLEKKRQVVASLLGSGAPIQDVNLVRRHLSRVKGGGLLRALGGPHIHSLVISDVVGGRASDVGSGPSMASPSDVRHARTVAARWLGHTHLPLQPCVGLADPLARRASHTILISPRSFAVRVARALARTGLGARVERAAASSLDALAIHLVARAHALASGEAIVLAAEPTLAVPRGARGRGGRASHLAVVVGPELPSGVTLLSLATDGVDGSSGHAGAEVSRATFRGNLRAARHALATFDAGAFVCDLGVHVDVPRGHNLTDVILLARPR